VTVQSVLQPRFGTVFWRDSQIRPFEPFPLGLYCPLLGGYGGDTRTRAFGRCWGCTRKRRKHDDKTAPAGLNSS